MNISKTIAAEVAVKLTAKKQEAINKLKNEFSGHLATAYKKQIPVSVLSEFKKNKGFFRQTTQVILEGHGFSYRRENIGDALPCKDNTLHLKMTEDEADTLLKISNGIDTLKAELTQVKQETENALLSLRTFKRVQENFPEAFEFLPKTTQTRLVVNLDALRNKLK